MESIVVVGRRPDDGINFLTEHPTLAEISSWAAASDEMY